MKKNFFLTNQQSISGKMDENDHS